MPLIASAKSGLTIRLTEERWQHITEGHPELAHLKSEVMQAIENPDKILEGSNSELLAIKLVNDNKYLVTIYKEGQEDGFVITAYLTRRINSLNKRKEVWPQFP
jgi:hypothetical protein